ncbi:aminotransferase class V-fold PLP-dependent enzyme [Aureitalea marina]|uniref:Aminotransferase class V n=1 Tax=Aureitalea marina TaxID=930804 RepID=A0A2S7KRN3_9FLAO|nr:aminotransferase class V-fold PLP-dependent enzyme [Aureitalea marina]PQB05276.1 aminotransferase class V [Aureitalea marina]
MMKCQADLFDLPGDEVYLNGAYMSPQLRSVTQVGAQQLSRKGSPSGISIDDFFQPKKELRTLFNELIHGEDESNVAIIPSVSYAMANVAANIDFKEGDEIVLLHEQFPSNYYTWENLVRSKEVKLVIVPDPKIEKGRGERWNQQLLAAINANTKVVAVPQVHWADGTLFDLAAIRKRADEFGAYLIVDGTQSVGAYPFSVEEIRPDALICAGYKWLMGPYSIGLAYFGPRFHQGKPIEDNWMNHQGSEDFARLVHYNPELKKGGVRYDVGESSNFILVPMLIRALKQLLEWTPEAIQDYTHRITSDALEALNQLDVFVEEVSFRSSHLFGIYLPQHMAMETVREQLKIAGIYVSYRGNAVRVSPGVYNTQEDLTLLVNCFKNF